MGADSIIYCLEQLTDYLKSERLCNELMILNLSPLSQTFFFHYPINFGIVISEHFISKTFIKQESLYDGK